MIRTSVAATLLGLATLPAAAQEGGPIRTGEHPDFTRVVLNVSPATEWSLETSTGEARLFFPARELDFGTDGVFERIPRTRVTQIRSETGRRGTTVTVGVNCDCRISASFVGGRFLALDVSDKDAPRPLEAIGADVSAAGPPESAPEQAPGAGSADAAATAAALAAAASGAEPSGSPADAAGASADDLAAAAAAARALLETEAVRSAETVLLEQLARAADQGLVRIVPDALIPSGTDPASGPARSVDAAPEPAQPAPVAAPPPPTEPEAPDAAARAAAEPAEDTVLPPADRPLARPGNEAPTTLAELALIEQIEAITVFDRDSASLRGRAAKKPLPETCVPDDRLDVGHWTNGLPLHAQTPQLMSRVLGEFDRPDPRAVRDLARLYIRFGFGKEAERAISGFGIDFEDAGLLADLARIVEGRPVAPDGPLAEAAACPGQHGLWLALGGSAPAFHDPAHFETVQAAFAEMPADLRGLLAPTLVGRLVEAGRPGEARLIQVTATRPGGPRSVEMLLAEARLLAAEGHVAEAAVELTRLAESPAHNALDALAQLARLAIDNGLALPDRLIGDLRTAVHQQRGNAREAELRGLLIEALAGRRDLTAAVEEVRIAQDALPDAAARFAALGQQVLASAEPDWVGAAAYADTVLNASDLIAPTAEADAARAAIADRLIEVGLPNAALALLAPPLARADAQSRILAARARLSLDEPEAALAELEGIEGFDALTLRAAALARAGDPEAAMALLEDAGAAVAADAYAWPSGAWGRVRDTDADPQRAAMAGYMAAREAPAPTDAAFDPDAALTPEAAFEAPLPPLETPSLGASRSLLAAGREVTAFLGSMLEGN